MYMNIYKTDLIEDIIIRCAIVGNEERVSTFFAKIFKIVYQIDVDKMVYIIGLHFLKELKT